jgi:NADPH2:quinone reductase
VTAAAGGLGSLLVQAARNAGAVVVGVVGGAEKVERVRTLGATIAVDYSADGWDRAVLEALDGRRPTVAFDGVGGELGVVARRLLAPGGRLLLFGFSSGGPSPISASDLWSQALTVSVAVGPHVVKRGLRPLEDTALAAAASGALVPLIGRPYALVDAAAAHDALASRATVGKTILVP